MQKKAGEKRNIREIEIANNNSEIDDFENEDDEDADYNSEGCYVLYYYTPCLSDKLNPQIV